MSQSGAIFSRRSTGLVREAGGLDTWIYNVNFISIGITAALMFLFIPAFYPGSNMLLGLAITTAVALPTALVYAMFSAAMPRSGADYVYVSRVLGPAWGVMSSWNMTVWWFLYGGVPSAFVARYGLSPMLRTLGAMTGNQGLISLSGWFVSAWGTFITGAVLIAVLTLIFIVGLRTFFKVQNVLFGLATLSLLVMIVVLVTSSRQGFLANFNHYMAAFINRGDAATYVMAQAAKNGFATAPLSIYFTLVSMTWIYLDFSFSMSSTFIGGEVKDASKRQLFSIPIALLYTCFWIGLTIVLLDNVAGLNLVGALGYLGGTPSTVGVLGSMGSAPVYSELIAFASGSVLPAFIILGGFIFWTYVWLPGQILNASRNLLAYSIDGVLPEWVGAVNSRFSTPHWSIIIVSVASTISLAIYVFTPYFATLVGMFGFILSFITVSIAAIVFPYRRPALWSGSPIAWRFAGLPVITWLGAVSVVVLVFMEWVFVNDPLSGLTWNQPPGPASTGKLMIGINLVIFLSGLVLYGIARWVRGRQGVDLSLNFKEVPVE